MRMDQDKIVTLHPDPARSGVRIDRWKYDLVRRAILTTVPRRLGGYPFRELPAALRGIIPQAQLRRLGSLTWYTVTVKLDLEARGEIERVPGVQPQRLRRVASARRMKA
jgi:hypothetical protein